jgi:hypothetical protein
MLGRAALRPAKAMSSYWRAVLKYVRETGLARRVF